MMRPPLLVIAFAALVHPLPLTAAAPRTHVVVIDKMKFGPVPAALRTGDTIVWVNRDMFKHTATARNRSFNVDLPPKGRARTVIRSAGSILFYCIYHPGMTGVLKAGR